MPGAGIAMLALSGALTLVGCGGGRSTGPSELATPAPIQPATPTARYRVTFQSTWTASSHPTDFPRNPHWSPLVGGTHSSAAQFWTAGGLASDGIEAMAELGHISPLDQEIEQAIGARTAEHVLRGPGIAASPGSATIDFEIGRDYPLVTLVSMMAPSPDWFAGVHDLSLLQGGDWVREKTVTLYPYDAGTDHGPTYESPDQDARPRQPIRAIEGFPLDLQGGVAPVGTFTFSLLQ